MSLMPVVDRVCHVPTRTQDLNRDVGRIDTIPSQSLETIKVWGRTTPFSNMVEYSSDYPEINGSSKLSLGAGLANVNRNQIL